MKRVLIIGAGGSGKTTLARRLAERTGLPLIHLDSIYWRSGWQATPPDEWQAKVAELIAGDSWIMDGNYGGTMDVRMEAADTVIFLDMSRVRSLTRIIRRGLRYYGRERPDLPAGCPERLTWEFVVWVWTYPKRRRGGILRRLEAAAHTKDVHILRTPRDVEAFLAAV
ncbi:MAG TPA: DNA topology modulation protein [Gemmatimonadaceae bacterium]|nr:DNA topology modulation protein [Gemmatimonadaceae bacterium]